MSRTLTAAEVDTEAAVAELERLIGALKRDEAFIQSLSHEENVTVESASNESVTVEYILTEEFQGIDPINHDTGRSEDVE